MGLRDYLNKNSSITTISSIVLLLLSLALLIYFMQGPRARVVQQDYFYDLGTGQLFNSDSKDPLPITAPSGPGKGAFAMVYGCGSCDEKDRFILYLVKYTDGYHQRVKNRPPTEDGKSEVGPSSSEIVIRTPEKDQWFPEQSMEAAQIKDLTRKPCPENKPLRPCNP